MDIVPSLLESIQRSFFEKLERNKQIKRVKKLIIDGDATYEEAQIYAVELGKILSESYEEHITVEVLPDGRMYFNIADRILSPTLKNNYTMTVEVTAEIQEQLNHKAGFRLKAVEPKVDVDRIEGIVNRISREVNFEDIAWILKEPIINFTQSAVDETLKQNVDFQGRSGVKAKIIRTAYGADPCDWCLSLEGTYEYPNVPQDVYRRHENCRCGVEYHVDGRRQNVWTKHWLDSVSGGNRRVD